MAETLTLTKPKRSRSTTGCIGCRLRRKKCGEEKPQCANCMRIGILCTWPDANNSKHAELLRRTNLTHRASSSIPKTTKLELSFPASSGDDAEKVCMELEGPIFEILSNIPHPFSPQAMMGNDALRHPSSLRLFHHYLERTNNIMARCKGTKNPFLMELIPMAMSNELILNGVLAFSGIHYADQAGVEADKATWVHYGHAIQGQKFGLTLLAQGRKDVVVPLLVTAMVLCIAESFRVGAGGLALEHLKAARFLLQEAVTLPESQLSRETRAFLIERYTYTMILAHITMGAAADAWVLDDMALLFPIMQNDAIERPSAMSGCVHELFQLIPLVSVLARKRKSDSRLGMESWQTRSQCVGLYSKIAAWQPTSLDEIDLLCGQLYQQALQVYLASAFEHDSDVPPTPPYMPSVEDSFNKFIPFLQAIPLESPISTTLCWPLAIFGSCATTNAARNVIRSRLAYLSERYAAQSVRDTLRLLEVLWRENDPNAANPMSLERIMKQEKMTVLFL